jgi:hypothetical protein
LLFLTDRKAHKGRAVSFRLAPLPSRILEHFAPTRHKEAVSERQKGNFKRQKAKMKEDESHAGFHPPFDFCLLPLAFT